MQTDRHAAPDRKARQTDMELPAYFLADRPPGAPVTPALLREACLTLKRNRARYLESRSTREIVQLLDAVAGQWRDPSNRFRKLALEHGPSETGFSRPALERGLDAFFDGIRGETLEEWIVAELGHRSRLDRFSPAPAGGRTGAMSLAAGPELLVHFAAGNIPNPALMSLITGLLARSAQLMKCASGQALLPRLFAHALYGNDPKIGACLEIAEWPGGEAEIESAVLAEAGCVTATGSDETLESIRRRLPGGTRFLGYGHRVSAGFVTRAALDGFAAGRWIDATVADICAWDQRGCLSPQVIFVEAGANLSPVDFAGRLAAGLRDYETLVPAGPRDAALASIIQSRRGFYEIRAAASPGTRVWASDGTTAWTVVLEEEPVFPPSCGHRFIFVKPVASLEGLLAALAPVQGQISTVGLAATEEEREPIARQLARRGVTRICPLGRMQQPPLAWHHDGRPALADLVTWVDLH